MKHSDKNRALPIRLIITYALMSLSVIAIVIVLTLALLGYRYNSQKGVLTQGGLVQFISQPSNARVTVGSATLGQQTRTKITLNPGNYLTKMELQGYQPWQKNITVKSGNVLWLNSTHFVPSNPETTSVLTTPMISSVQARPGGKYLALLKTATTPTITLVSTDKDTVETEDVTLPSTSYSDGAQHEFTLEKWDNNDSQLLMKHVVDGKTEYVVMNVTDPEKSAVITGSDPASQPASILFDPRSDDSVIVQYANGDVRTVKLSTGERSDILIQNVAEMTLTSSSRLLYSTTPTASGVAIGYLTLGAETPRQLDSVLTTQPVHISGGEYYYHFYLAKTVGNTTTIKKYDNFANSDSDTALNSTVLKTFSLPGNATAVSFKGGNRFITVQQPATETTYDLELSQQHDIKIEGATNIITPLVWLDSYHFWSDTNGKLRQYEFDGTNQTDIVSVSQGYNVVYSPNQKYLYSVGKDSSGKMRVQRTLMILNQ